MPAMPAEPPRPGNSPPSGISTTPASPVNTGKPGRILGIDPGLAAAGWGIIDSRGSRLVHIDHGIIATSKDHSPARRLLVLHRELSALIEVHRPGAMAVETLFFTKNISSAIPVAQARGVILLTAARHGLQVGEFSPMTIKQSVVGTGSAEKHQVQDMTRLLLGLAESPASDHAADALAVAVTFSHNISPWSTASAAS